MVRLPRQPAPGPHSQQAASRRLCKLFTGAQEREQQQAVVHAHTCVRIFVIVGPRSCVTSCVHVHTCVAVRAQHT